MKKINLLSLLFLLAACHGGAIFDDETSKDLTTPPSNLMARKPLVNPKDNKPIDTQADSRGNMLRAEQNTEQRVSRTPSSPVSFHYDAAYLQQLYSVLITRTTNKMLKATSAIYNSKKTTGVTPTIYVPIPENENPSVTLPNLDYAGEVAKNIISSSHSYQLVEDSYNSSYVLSISLAQREDYNRKRPILSCRMILRNQNNKEIGTWVETLSPVSNDDRSWW